MDVIFKIAGWMILILIGLVDLMVLVNNWEDIILFFSNLSSTSAEEESGKHDEAEQFKAQVFDILKYRGQYNPKLQLKIYDDNNITIYEDKRITWKHRSGNPREDCINYVRELHASCIEKEASSRKTRENLARIREEEKAKKVAEQKAYRVKSGESITLRSKAKRIYNYQRR